MESRSRVLVQSAKVSEVDRRRVVLCYEMYCTKSLLIRSNSAEILIIFILFVLYKSVVTFK